MEIEKIEEIVYYMMLLTAGCQEEWFARRESLKSEHSEGVTRSEWLAKELSTSEPFNLLFCDGQPDYKSFYDKYSTLF